MYIVMLLLLSMGVALTLAGCRAFRTEKQENLPEDPPICGDRTHRIDEAAPTTIVSKEITAFSASFYYTDQYEDGIFREGKYSFVIEESENREWILTMSGPFQASTVVEKEVLADVQEILDKYQLAESNGLYSVTAGLPPEFTPCALSVEYASGEQLAFTMDGDPGVLWYTAFLDYFLQVFIDAGHTEYLPPAGDDIPEEWYPMREQLKLYLDAAFAAK